MIFLIGCAIRITVILAVAFIAIRFSRSRSAALRHSILAAAILCAAGVPVLTVIVPARSVTVRLPRETTPVPVAFVFPEEIGASPSTPPETIIPAEMERSAAPVFSPQLKTAPRIPSIAEPSSFPVKTVRISKVMPVRWTFAQILTGLWIGGMAAGLLSLLSGAAQLASLTRKSRPITSGVWKRIVDDTALRYGLRRTIRLVESGDPSLLMTWGMIRPVLMIPAGAEHWPEARIRVAVCHELAHIRRGDWPIQIAAELLRSVYWFNPLTWIACRVLAQEGEQACDDVALESGISGSDYADQLLVLAQILNAPHRTWSAALSMAHPSTLERRFAAMLNAQVSRRRLTGRSIASTSVVFLLITLTVAALRIVAASQVSQEIPVVSATSVLQSVQAVVMAIRPAAEPATQPVQTGPAMVAGTVVQMGTNEPISDVNIEMTRVEGTTAFPLGPPVLPQGQFSPGARVSPGAPNPSEIFAAKTKSDGTFAFTSLVPGTYRLLAARAGGAYLPAEYGQHSPKGAGYNFALADGQAMKGIRLEMAPTGSISGRVLDGNGKPAGRARVMVLERTYQNDHGGLSIVQAMYTDDRGDYRMFWLPPGRYLVAARPEDDPRRRSLLMFVTPPLADTTGGWEAYSQASITMRGMPNGELVEETCELVYFGGDTDPQKAKTVDLRPGMNAGGIDISLSSGKMRARHVRGMVIDGSDGLGLANATITANPVNAGPSVVIPKVSSRWDGSFDLPGLGSGAYVIHATVAPDNRPIAGVVAIGPGESNADNVKIAVTRGFEVSGRVVIDGSVPAGTSPDLNSFRVSLSPDIGVLATTIGLRSNAADGTFAITGLQSGDYRVIVSKPAGSYVKSIRLGPDDGLNGKLHLAATPSGELEVVVGMNAGKLDGVVFDERQQPAVNAMVVLVPAIALRQRRDLYKTANTDRAGHFQFQGITPGDYKILSAKVLANGVWFDADFMRSMESLGYPTRVAEGTNGSVRVPLIPE